MYIISVESFISPSGTTYYVGLPVFLLGPKQQVLSGRLESYRGTTIKIRDTKNKLHHVSIQNIDNVVPNEIADQGSLFSGTSVLVKVKKHVRVGKIAGFYFKVALPGRPSRWVRSGELRKLVLGSVKCRIRGEPNSRKTAIIGRHAK